MQHFKSILLSFMLLMFCWQSSIAQSDELEYIFADMQQAFPECLANYTINDFADTYELIVFMEQECNIAINDFFPTDGDDWNGGNDWGGEDDDPSVDDGTEWTVADEWEILASQFPWCFENTQPGQFDSFDALYYYFETTCFNDSIDVAVDDLPWDDWGGNDDPSVDDGILDDNGEWTVADEYEILAQQFPWCFDIGTPEMFETFEELYEHLEICLGNDSTDVAVDDLPWDDWGGNDDDGNLDDGMLDDNGEWTVADEWGILSEQFPWCFENTQPGQFDSFDALYYYFETTCFNDSIDIAVDDLPWDDGGGNDDETVDDGMLDDNGEWTVADEWQILSEQFPWCFENTQPGQFDSFDALYYYLETTCFNDSLDVAVDDLPWDDWGGNDDETVDDGMLDDNGEWTVADEWGILSEQFPWCFENTQPGQFDSFDALYYYFETTCFNDSTDIAVDDLPWDDWGGNDDDGNLDDGMTDDWGAEDDWNWTVEDELMWLQQQFPECLDSVTAEMFDGFEALYEYVENNCFNTGSDEPWTPELPDCVFNIVFDEATTLQDFISGIIVECGDIIELPDCIVQAPQFDTDEAFIEYLFENCEMFDGIGLSNPNDGMTSWDNAAQWYNLAPILNGSPTAITTVSSLNITTYPNPADTHFNIEIETINTYTVELYDISGKLVYTSVAKGNNTIDVSHLNTGIYLLDITSGNSHYSIKMHIK